ncbi:MAG: DEAD/DEAH box helicase, partial [Sutterella sp.]
DEAQAIKNYKTAGFRAVRTMKGDAFIAMSGTPVENSLMEYWSVMEAANPGLLGTPTSFRTDFAQPIENGHDSTTAERFRRITSPFILRRLKTDRTIISDLPDKVTTDEYCVLNKVQTALYHAAVECGMQKIEKTNDRFERRALVLQLIIALKQICNSPAQYEPAGGYEDPVLSGKMLRLFDILEEMQAAGRKVLIFTQFAQMGMLLQQWIEDRTGRRPQFLHGGLTPARRQEMVDRFQKRRDENVMVLTLKAAGTGLNLTAASAVIHYDLWWNAAVENQATDRAYRIGQTSTVNLYRFICANTFEERINAMIAEKRRLVEMTVAAGENWIGDLTNEELEQVFSLSEHSESDQPADRAGRVKLLGG